MILKAIGKYIDTMPLAKLFSQEEACADCVTIVVDRIYGKLDISDFIFVMRGITESGGETETELVKTVEDDVIQLSWEVGKNFTAESGTLALDLFAYGYAESSAENEESESETQPDYIIRYQLPSVQVRALPDSNHTLDTQSYTEILIQIKEAGEDALAKINAVVLNDAATLSAMQTSIDFLHNYVVEMVPIVSQHTEQIEELYNRVEVIILKQSEYDAITEPDENTLYVITDVS